MSVATYWCRPEAISPEHWQVDPDNRVYASFHLDRIEYGHNRQTVGHVRLTANWTLSGPALLARPIQFWNSQETIATLFRGYVMDGTRRDLGTTVNRCYDGRYGITSAGSLRQWLPKGCTLYDNASKHHESVIEVRWKLSGYPGYWFVYVKSPVAYSQDRTLYLFTQHLPVLPWGAGHA